MSEDQPINQAEPGGLPSYEPALAEAVEQGRDSEDHAPVQEDDPGLLDRTSRSLDVAPVSSGESVPETVAAPTRPGSEDEGAGDSSAGQSESVAAEMPHVEQTGDWENELSAHRVAVELRRIESEVRAMLEDRDPKRKRKFTGTHRWHELEEDIISWRFSGRFDEDTLRRAQELINRRHYLFQHLRFLASTRPTWNT